MNVYDKSSRTVMTNALVQFVTIASSSLWFAMSVAALCIAAIIPFRKSKLPPTSPRLYVDTTVVVHPNSRSSSPGQASMLVPRDGNYHITLDNTTGAIRRSVLQGPTTFAITIVPPISGEITITALPDCHDIAVTATLNPPICAVVTEEPQDVVEVASSAPTSSQSDSLVEEGSTEHPSKLPLPSSDFSQRRAITSVRIPSVLRRKIKRSLQDGSTRTRSRSRSLSPVRKLLAELKPEPEESAIAHGRIPYRPNPDDHETFETKFVNPFKRKPRRSASPSPFSTPEKTSCELPPCPTSPPTSARAPRRTFASYINRAMRPLHDSASRSPSPRRWSLSSSVTSSSDASSSTGSSCRSFPMRPCSSRSNSTSERSASRTQPYGAPYFAAMPMPIQRQSSSGRIVVETSGAIYENKEVQEQGAERHLRRASTVARTTAFEDDRELGVSLGQETTRHRRYRSLGVRANVVR